MKANIYITGSMDGIGPLSKLCGITLVERTVLTLRYAGVSSFTIYLGDDNRVNEKVKHLCSKHLSEDRIVYLKGGDLSRTEELCFSTSTVFDISYARWLINPDDTTSEAKKFFKVVNTKNDLLECERALIARCRKDNDGFITYVYRFLSLFFTKYLCRMPLSPNQISGLTVLISFIGALMMVSGFMYLYILGLLFQILANVVDCCDGEVARLKFHFSSIGDWVDTTCDNLTTLFFISALAYVNYQYYGSGYDVLLGGLNLGFFMLFVVFSSIMLYRIGKSGSLLEINDSFRQKSLLSKIIAELVRRDLNTIIFVFLAMLGFTRFVLIMSLIGMFGLSVYSGISLFTKRKPK